MERDLLAALAGAPDDPEARRVYVDWLRERDDPRGELLALTDRLRALDFKGEPFWAGYSRWDALRRAVPADWLAQVDCEPVTAPIFAELADDRVTCWRQMRLFIARWYRPLEPEDGMTDAELDAAESRFGRPFPAAVREWWGMAGRFTQPWSPAMGRAICSPAMDVWLDQLSPGADGGFLLLKSYNTFGPSWSVVQEHWDAEDPSVRVGRYESPDGLTALLAYAMIDLMPHLWHAGPHEEFSREQRPGLVVAEAEAGLSQDLSPALARCHLVGIPLWHQLADGSMPSRERLYEGRQLVAMSGGNASGACVVARSEAALGAHDAQALAGLRRWD